MQAGKLRHRVTLQEYTAGRDSFNAEIEQWIDIATLWAAIEPVSGDEQYQQRADQVLAIRQVRIRIRQRPELDRAKLRVIHGERIFDVQAVEIDPTLKRQMVLVCEERNV